MDSKEELRACACQPVSGHSLCPHSGSPTSWLITKCSSPRKKSIYLSISWLILVNCYGVGFPVNSLWPLFTLHWFSEQRLPTSGRGGKCLKQCYLKILWDILPIFYRNQALKISLNYSWSIFGRSLWNITIFGWGFGFSGRVLPIGKFSSLD